MVNKYLFALICTFIFQYSLSAQDQYRVISSSSLNVRTGAGTNYQVLGVVKPGEEINVIEIDGDWAKITLSNNTYGFVNKNYIEKIFLESTSKKKHSGEWSLFSREFFDFLINDEDIPRGALDKSTTATFFFALAALVLAALLLMLIAKIGKNSYTHDYWPLLAFGMLFGAINGYVYSWSFHFDILPAIVVLIYLVKSLRSREEIYYSPWRYFFSRFLAFILAFIVTLIAYKFSYIHFLNISWFWGIIQFLLLLIICKRLIGESASSYNSSSYVNEEVLINKNKRTTLSKDKYHELVWTGSNYMLLTTAPGWGEVQPFEDDEGESWGRKLKYSDDECKLYHCPGNRGEKYILFYGSTYVEGEYQEKNPDRRSYRNEPTSGDDNNYIISRLEENINNVKSELNRSRSDLNNTKSRLDSVINKDITTTYHEYQKNNDIYTYESQISEVEYRILQSERELSALQDQLAEAKRK